MRNSVFSCLCFIKTLYLGFCPFQNNFITSFGVKNNVVVNYSWIFKLVLFHSHYEAVDHYFYFLFYYMQYFIHILLFFLSLNSYSICLVFWPLTILSCKRLSNLPHHSSQFFTWWQCCLVVSLLLGFVLTFLLQISPFCLMDYFTFPLHLLM